tara:strand:- start:2026 stop:2763 length:738 start_codon:yes stop_codon:yes gene_type:complete
MIIVDSISKSFSGNIVLDNFSSKFEPGRINLIIGRSGSGKTMTIKCMLGLHQVDSGSVYFDNRNFTRLSETHRKKIRKEIGMVFQGSALFDSMTVSENVMFPLIMSSKMTKAKMIERANFCLNRVDLKNVNNLYPSELSGGMQKRVAIARAIALNPKYLFCDEPNSGLDPATAKVIDSLLKEITYEYKITTVINTHDMNSVVDIGDRIIYIEKGCKKWEGDKKTFLETDDNDLQLFKSSSKLFTK